MTKHRYAPIQLHGRRVLVMGLGTRQGGLGVTRYLVRAGAEVTVTDLRGADELRSSLDALDGLPVQFRLGEHRDEDFDAAELIVRNPGVPYNSPWLRRARARGIPIEMEMSLFFRACPAPLIGITGTKGKTSSSTFCHRILRERFPDAVLAGNMGTSALEQLPQIGEDTPVVIELSSWQLEGLAEYEMSPEIAVLTNISEDHLNRYNSMSDYIEAKRHITRFQQAGDWFIVNRNQAECWESRTLTAAQVVPFGRLDPDENGAGIEHGSLYWQRSGIREPIVESAALPFHGEHVALNALAASAAALVYGATVADARAGLSGAEPVPHRQESVATIDGVEYINDTTATAPAAAIAALETFRDRSIVLIAGGAGKGTSLERFATLAARRASAIMLLDGDETGHLRDLLLAAGATDVSEPLGSMREAVTLAAQRAERGGVVLLSPACASFGLFRDEFHRGDAFRTAVRQLRSATTGGGA